MTSRVVVTSPAPRARRGAPVVARVLEVTLEELARVGLHRLSVPAVSARAGLHKTSVYRRWPTKRALVAAALAQAMGHGAPLPDTGSLHGDMRAFVRSAVAFADSPVGRGVLRTLLAEGTDPEARALVAALRRGREAGPRALFVRAVARGELAAGADVRMAATAVAGAITHRLFVEQARITPAFVDRLVAWVAAGLGAPVPQQVARRISGHLSFPAVAAMRTPPEPPSAPVFHALGDGTRRRILVRLAEGERSVGELLAVLAVPSQPALSQHLKVLREAGLVVVRRDGRSRLYALDPRPLAALRAWFGRLESFREGQLAALGHVLAGDL